MRCLIRVRAHWHVGRGAAAYSRSSQRLLVGLLVLFPLAPAVLALPPDADQPNPPPAAPPAPVPAPPPAAAPGPPAPGVAAAPGQVAFPYVLRDAFDGNWDVQQDGTIGDGGNNVYDSGGRLTIVNGQNEEQYACPQPAAEFDARRNELILAPAEINGLKVGRRVKVDAKKGWCRWVETIENPGPQAVHVQVHINFDLGGAIQQTQELLDAKASGFGDRPRKQAGKPVGLATFDGNHALAMVGAGRGSPVPPLFQYQPGNDQVDLFYGLDIPPKKTVAVAHVQVHRSGFGDVAHFAESARSNDYVADLPKDVAALLVNFPKGEKTLGDFEILRGDALDVVELRNGDQYRGTIREPAYHLDTTFGPIDLPAGQVIGMMTVGSFEPTQLFITADGQAVGGVLRADAVRLQLSGGRVTSIPLGMVRRLGYRKRPGEPEEWKLDQPMAFLRDGQRVGIHPPADAIRLSTVYGALSLKPGTVAAVIFQGEDQPMHQVRLADGSKFAALVAQDAFDLRLRTADGGAGPGAGTGDKPARFPVTSLSRLQFAAAPDEPDEQAPTLTLANGDVLVAGLSGVLELETGFDTIRINGPEVHALRHTPPPEDAPGSPAEVRVTLWDNATVSGRLKGDVVTAALGCGTPIRVPVALVADYEQPNPMPTPEVLEQIKATVAELDAGNWKQRDRATDRLIRLGPPVTGVLKSLKGSQTPGVQKQIDSIVARLDEIRKAAKAPPPPPQPPVQPQMPEPNDADGLVPVPDVVPANGPVEVPRG